MELYVFDATHQLIGVVESFEYLRWTRRYSHCGSFELQAVADANNLNLLRIGHILWKSNDDEACYIEYSEQSMEKDESILVKGRFATGAMGRRIIWGTETLKGDISAVISQLISWHMTSPSSNERKITDFSFSATPFDVPVNTQVSYRNLLETVESLCDAAEIGIKTVWNPNLRRFTITLYKGEVSQAVFSKEYENLTSQTFIQSELDCCNVAFVAGEGEGDERKKVIVGSGDGMNRREIFVDAKDLRQENFGVDYAAALTQRGEAKLAELSPVRFFDAEINPHGNLTYKTDFDIGQMVKVVSKAWCVTLTTRITEIEETYDRDGLSLQVTFGRGLLTLAQKLKGGF